MERAPRYTSYPTAPHFHDGITGGHYLSWLDSLGADDTLSLYFHIPYCKQLCWFCGCHTKVVNQYEPVAHYLDILKKEVALVSSHTQTSPVKHIHFGGGSPTILAANDFVEFMNLLGTSFSITKGAEIAIEIDPRTVDAEKIEAYAKAGVTRASIGVQDFDLKVQEAINRVQPYEIVHDVMKGLRAQHIRALNIDLIYGLPYQTQETIRRTIEQTLTLDPDRISLFGYAHVPWMKKHQKLVPEDALPSKDTRKAMFESASALLLQAGYVAIGLDHFAKPDDPMAKAAIEKTLQRNFQGYTTDAADALIGMGVSSISSLPQGYAQNSSNNSEYQKAIMAGTFPIIKGIELTTDDKNRRNIIMSLMCNLLAHIPKSDYSTELVLLKPYIESGDITYENEVLQINPAARSKLRLITAIFDSYLASTTHRYSQSV